MPIDYSRYPPTWKTEIRQRIWIRARNRCEKCGLRQGDWIVRKGDDWRYYDSLVGTEFQEWGRPVKIMLTIHHIGVPKPDGTPGDPHDKMDCRDENLILLCQRCHLLADLPPHIAKAKVTRRAKKHRNQLKLLED